MPHNNGEESKDLLTSSQEQDRLSRVLVKQGHLLSSHTKPTPFDSAFFISGSLHCHTMYVHSFLAVPHYVSQIHLKFGYFVSKCSLFWDFPFLHIHRNPLITCHCFLTLPQGCIHPSIFAFHKPHALLMDKSISNKREIRWCRLIHFLFIEKNQVESRLRWSK